MQAGYLTIGMGKIFHEGGNCDYQDVNHSWSPEAVYPHSKGGEGPQGGLYDPQGYTNSSLGLLHQFPDAQEKDLQDGLLTDHAVAVLGDLAERRRNGSLADRPFFLAVGLHK